MRLVSGDDATRDPTKGPRPSRTVHSLFVCGLPIRCLPRDSYVINHGRMARMEYYHDVAAPQARELLPTAFAVVRNGLGRVLLVRRIDDGYWELSGGRAEVGESASTAVVREVAEEAGVTIRVTGLAGVYSDPGHVLAYPGEGIYQQLRCASSPSPQPAALSLMRTRRSPRRGSIPSKQHS
jgi:hypothetical protein